MQYRDERDALRGRVENLEQDLAGAREELARHGGADRRERIAKLEAQMAEGRRLLAAMSSELAELKGEGPARPAPIPPPSRTPATMPFVLVAGMLAVAFATGGWRIVRVRRAFHAAHSAQAAQAADGRDRAQRQAPQAFATADGTPRVQTPETRHTVARWTARVTRATGKALSAGTPCIVDAVLSSDGSAIHVDRTTVTCGRDPLYDSDARLEGMSMSGAGVDEDATETKQAQRYAFRYDDTGARSGPRTQTSINSIAGVGAVWSDSMPAFRVELALPYQTDPVQGAALLDATRGALRRGATVVSTDGAAPLAKGARCNVRVTPHPGGTECLTHLVCGAAVVYGKPTMGVAACTVRDGEVVQVSDANPSGDAGDPELQIDTAAGTMELADVVGTARWSVAFRLDDAP